MMKVAKVSAHVVYDRMDRMMLIAKYIGWGEIVLEVRNPERNNNCINCLTSTGVLIVKGENGTLVTAYPASLSQVKALYGMYNYDRIPEYLFNRVMKNQKLMRKMGM